MTARRMSRSEWALVRLHRAEAGLLDLEAEFVDVRPSGGEVAEAALAWLDAHPSPNADAESLLRAGPLMILHDVDTARLARMDRLWAIIQARRRVVRLLEHEAETYAAYDARVAQRNADVARYGEKAVRKAARYGVAVEVAHGIVETDRLIRELDDYAKELK